MLHDVFTLASNDVANIPLSKLPHPAGIANSTLDTERWLGEPFRITPELPQGAPVLALLLALDAKYLQLQHIKKREVFELC